MNDSRKAQITSRIKSVAALARARQEARQTPGPRSYMPSDHETVQASEVSLLLDLPRLQGMRP